MHLRLCHCDQSARADNFAKCAAPGTSLLLQGHSEGDKGRKKKKSESVKVKRQASTRRVWTCWILWRARSHFSPPYICIFVLSRCASRNPKSRPPQHAANATLDADIYAPLRRIPVKVGHSKLPNKTFTTSDLCGLVLLRKNTMLMGVMRDVGVIKFIYVLFVVKV